MRKNKPAQVCRAFAITCDLQPLAHCATTIMPSWTELLMWTVHCISSHRHAACSTRSVVAMASDLAGDVMYLDGFAIRQWDDPHYSGTRISYDKAEFVRKVHEYHKEGRPLVDGYVPFCKHVFVPNFVGAKAGNVKITDDIKGAIETAYESRRPEELAVLSRCASLLVTAELFVSALSFAAFVLHCSWPHCSWRQQL